MEILLIWWDKDNINDLKLYANRDNVEIKFPYNHRVAKSYIDLLKILLKEYPEDIEIRKDFDFKDFNLPVEMDDKKEFLFFIDKDGNKRYISSVPLETLNKIFPDIERLVTKGVRLDVH